MFWLSRFDRHARLVDRMEATLGIDPGEALAQGRLRAEDLRTAVLSCMGCKETGACEEWLEAHAGGADSAPGYCRNRDLFSRLVDEA